MFDATFVIVLGLLLFGVWFFMIIPFVLGRVGGWAALGAEYRLAGPFEGTRWRFRDITLRGWCTYSGCVSVGANPVGLYLNTVFWVMHPPLLIPWEDLRVSERQVKFFGMRVGAVEFAVARVPGVRVTLRESLLKKIAASGAATLRWQPASTPESATLS